MMARKKKKRTKTKTAVQKGKRTRLPRMEMETAYVTGDKSIAAIAKQFDASERQTFLIAKENSWVAKRTQYRSQVAVDAQEAAMVASAVQLGKALTQVQGLKLSVLSKVLESIKSKRPEDLSIDDFTQLQRLELEVMRTLQPTPETSIVNHNSVTVNTFEQRLVEIRQERQRVIDAGGVVVKDEGTLDEGTAGFLYDDSDDGPPIDAESSSGKSPD